MVKKGEKLKEQKIQCGVCEKEYNLAENKIGSQIEWGIFGLVAVGMVYLIWGAFNKYSMIAAVFAGFMAINAKHSKKYCSKVCKKVGRKKETKSWVTIIIIALIVKSLFFEIYAVPTGSMLNTIQLNDFLIGNRFVYGMRTPDRLGLIWTRVGFNVPYFQLPGFTKPKAGDIVIFEFPRDKITKYVKRCVAGPGQTFEIVDKQIFIDGDTLRIPRDKLDYSYGKEIPKRVPEHGGFFTSAFANSHYRGFEDSGGKPKAVLNSKYNDKSIYANHGNKDHFRKFRVPQKGDSLAISETAQEILIQIMLLDGHQVEFRSGGKTYEFTMTDPLDVASVVPQSRQQSIVLEYFEKMGEENLILPFPMKHRIRQWERFYMNRKLPTDLIFVDGKSLSKIKNYEVEQDYYFMVGDNRDGSYDSRYWGPVPFNHILGQAMVNHFSVSGKFPFIRFERIGNILR